MTCRDKCSSSAALAFSNHFFVRRCFIDRCTAVITAACPALPDENTPHSIRELLMQVQQSSVGAIPQDLEVRMLKIRLDDSGILTTLDQRPISETYPYQVLPSSAFSLSQPLAARSTDLWILAKSLLAKSRPAFEGNEPEGSWIRIASDLLEGVFEQAAPHGMLRVMDVCVPSLKRATNDQKLTTFWTFVSIRTSTLSPFYQPSMISPSR